jgi:virulence factor Mce-like protein
VRRRFAAAVAAVLVGAGVVALPADGEDSFRIDVVFDDSRGLLVGQLVQVAGARVGEIVDVTVTEDYKARVHLEVDRRFAPFREDATCTIKPSGLIAENYVQCDPGTPDAGALEADGDTPPTVPVENTTQPVSLTDLFEVWNTPTRERLGVLLSTLGMSTAGHGEDLNDILRRANPSLQLARETIALLERQRDDLAAIVDRAGVVADELAERPEHLTGLTRHAGRVLTHTASQRGALGEGVRRLPGLLEQAQPALAKLDALSAAATPLVRDLEEAAPALNRVSADVPRLAQAARPTLAALAPVLRSGARSARDAAPVATLVARYARESLPSTMASAEMLATLEQRGFVRGLVTFFYNAAMASARYDEQGHLIPAHVTFTECGMKSATPDPECGAAIGAPAAEREDAPRRRRGARPQGDEPRVATPEGERPRVPRIPELPRLPGLPRLPDLDDLPPLPQIGPGRAPQQTVDDLMDFLFG